MADLPASVRVFAIPELLENILLQSGQDNGKADRQWISFVKDLFVFQRVDTTFKNTINGSIKLRRAMLLEYDEDSAKERPSGLEFFFNRYTPWHPSVPCIAHTVERTSIRGTNVKVVYIGMEATLDRPIMCACLAGPEITEGDIQSESLVRFENYFQAHASWRRMKLFNMHRVVFLHMSLGGESSWPPFGYSISIPAHTERQTLGGMHDAVNAAASRSSAEHVVASAEFELAMRAFRMGWDRAVDRADDLDCEVSQRFIQMKRYHDSLAQEERSCDNCYHCSKEVSLGQGLDESLRHRYLNL